MKPTAVLALTWILLTPGAVAHAQEFQNLDFEQAMPELPGPPGDDRYRYAANVLPHWLVDAYPGSNGAYPPAYNTYGHIGYDPPLIHVFGGDGVSTDDPPSPNQYRAVAGNYSAALDPRNGWTSLQQTGLIPSGSRSLRFSGYIVERPQSDWDGYGDVDVSLNGVSLSIHDLGPVVGATYRRGGEQQVFQYGVNIPPGLAGTTATLKFYAAGELLSAFLVLDDIQFSPVAIPEPATLGLAAISALALMAVGRSAKKPRA
jgi:hypothetical protein